MIIDVNGDRVTPVKKPTIPDKISKLVQAAKKWNQPATNEPTLAPALNAGVNMPPAAPVVNDNIGPAILNAGVYQCTYLAEVSRVFCMISLPEPRISRLTK